MAHRVYSAPAVSRALDLSRGAAKRAVSRGDLSTVGKRHVKGVGYGVISFAFNARGVAIWMRRSSRGKTYEELMERCLELAAELEERDGRTLEA